MRSFKLHVVVTFFEVLYQLPVLITTTHSEGRSENGKFCFPVLNVSKRLICFSYKHRVTWSVFVCVCFMHQEWDLDLQVFVILLITWRRFLPHFNTVALL